MIGLLETLRGVWNMGGKWRRRRKKRIVRGGYLPKFY